MCLFLNRRGKRRKESRKHEVYSYYSLYVPANPSSLPFDLETRSITISSKQIRCTKKSTRYWNPITTN